MKRFTDAGRAAIEQRNYYAALSLALMLPDVCGSLEAPGTGGVGKRYMDWCERWIAPRYIKTIAGHQVAFLTAKDIYGLRNSLLHAGTGIIDPKKADNVDRIEFVAQRNTHALHINGVLVLSAEVFSMEVFDAVDAWDQARSTDPKAEESKAHLLRINAVLQIGSMRIGPPA